MKYLKRRRFFKSEPEDPLGGVANLFDIGLVFVVSLLLALMSVYHLQDFFNEKSDITIMKKSPKGNLEIIIKKGKVIKIEGIEEALKIKGVKHIILRGKIGDIIENYKNCVTRFCFILAVADTIEEVNKICDNAENLINIVTE